MSIEQQWNNFKKLMADSGLGEIPEPELGAWQLHSALVNKVNEKIASSENNAISFSDYMFHALYEPGLGYYSAGLTKFGKDGDFVTAPELSPLFGACIANQVEEIFVELNNQGVNDLAILEFGPGSGALCISILKALEQKNKLPDVYYLIEVSPYLRQLQQANISLALPHLHDRIQWLDELPEEIKGVVLANEVLDAMPVERFQIAADKQVNSLGVIVDNGQLKSKPIVAEFELKIAIENIEQSLGYSLAEGYSSEINLWIEPWLKSLSSVLTQGVALLIDYGYPRAEYYHEQRSCGTLMCHYRQRAHEDPLLLTGLQDITAYVDFTAVAEAADNYGLKVAGFTNQAQFLLACGLDTLVQLEQGAEPDKNYRKKVQQVKWLTLPSEMGDRFKVMALCQDYDQELKGFSLADFLHRL